MLFELFCRIYLVQLAATSNSLQYILLRFNLCKISLFYFLLSFRWILTVSGRTVWVLALSVSPLDWLHTWRWGTLAHLLLQNTSKPCLMSQLILSLHVQYVFSSPTPISSEKCTLQNTTSNVTQIQIKLFKRGCCHSNNIHSTRWDEITFPKKQTMQTKTT